MALAPAEEGPDSPDDCEGRAYWPRRRRQRGLKARAVVEEGPDSPGDAKREAWKAWRREREGLWTLAVVGDATERLVDTREVVRGAGRCWKSCCKWPTAEKTLVPCEMREKINISIIDQ